jgi:hypothetical protein
MWKLGNTTPTREDWIKMAVWIDAEGCIEGLHSRTGKRRCLSLRVAVTVFNTDPRVFLWCHKTFGGGGKSIVRKRNYGRPCYNWRCSGRCAKWILENCLEHFLIKREQAEIALALYATTLRQGGQNGALTPELIFKREAMFSALKSLKHQQHQPPVIQ